MAGTPPPNIWGYLTVKFSIFPWGLHFFPNNWGYLPIWGYHVIDNEAQGARVFIPLWLSILTSCYFKFPKFSPAALLHFHKNIIVVIYEHTISQKRHMWKCWISYQTLLRGCSRSKIWGYLRLTIVRGYLYVWGYLKSLGVPSTPLPAMFTHGQHTLNFSSRYPWLTLPNMVCFLSSSGQASSVKKNCDPLSLGPEFAMATRPRREKRRRWWNSSYKSNKQSRSRTR